MPVALFIAATNPCGLSAAAERVELGRCRDARLLGRRPRRLLGELVQRGDRDRVPDERTVFDRPAVGVEHEPGGLAAVSEGADIRATPEPGSAGTIPVSSSPSAAWRMAASAMRRNSRSSSTA